MRPRGCAGRAAARPPPPGWPAVELHAAHPRSRPRPAASAARPDDRDQFGVGLADHHPAAGLDDPRLVGGDPLEGGPEHLGVVEAHVGDHGHLAVDHVGAVPGAPRGRPRPRRRRRPRRRTSAARRPSASRSGWAVPSASARAGQRREHLGQLVVVDRLAVAGEPLVDPGQVGAGVRAHASAPWPRAGRSTMAAVEPLPLVPVRWTTGNARWGSPSSGASSRMRSRVGSARRVGVADS